MQGECLAFRCLFDFFTVVGTICSLSRSYFSAVWTSISKTSNKNADDYYYKTDETNVGFNSNVIIIIKQFYAHNTPINEKDDE